jgi:copper chaperone CopZ
MVKVTLGIEGMLCPKCEAHMSEAIKNSFKAKSVVCSHTDKRAVFVCAQDVTEQGAASVVSEAGYTLPSFKTEPYKKPSIFSFGKK